MPPAHLYLCSWQDIQYHRNFAPQVANTSLNVMRNCQELKQGSSEQPLLTWNHPYTSCIGKLMSCWKSIMSLSLAWVVSVVQHSPSIMNLQTLHCKHPGAVLAQPKQDQGSGIKREWSVGLELGTATIDTQYFFLLYNLLVHAASGGHKERSTYPSQCRDKDEKFFAQKTLKVPAACTGTCLPPATSSSLQPHNTASSQRPSGRWGIPVMEESTAQMNATGATRKNRLTQKLFFVLLLLLPPQNNTW